MSEQSVINCRGLTKSYRTGFWLTPKAVLHDVSFGVSAGDIFGFLGPNGAGKTTTIKILLGLVRAGGGECALFGEPLGSARARARLGFLPDNPYFYDELNALQTLALAGRMFDLSGKEVRIRSERLLERVALDSAAWKLPVRKYSRGMLQRLGIAQSLISDPQLLIWDEPMGGLDPIGRYEVRDLMRALRDEGKTIFFSTHILSDVEALCDRVAVIVEGRVRRTGPLSELLAPKIKGYELSVADLPAEKLAAVRSAATWVREEPGGIVLARISDKERAEALARDTVNAGGRLVALVPQKEDLDDYFYRLVREGEEEPRA